VAQPIAIFFIQNHRDYLFLCISPSHLLSVTCSRDFIHDLHYSPPHISRTTALWSGSRSLLLPGELPCVGLPSLKIGIPHFPVVPPENHCLLYFVLPQSCKLNTSKVTSSLPEICPEDIKEGFLK
jgi:hypothetical protein